MLDFLLRCRVQSEEQKKKQNQEQKKKQRFLWRTISSWDTKMKLLQFLFILQLSSFSPALLDASAPDAGPQMAPEDTDDDPYVRPLGSTCRWTLSLPGTRSGEAVPLPPDALDSLADRICRDLKCGRVHVVTKTTAPGRSSCFQNCVYRDRRLQNCSETSTPGCIGLTNVVCGETFLILQDNRRWWTGNRRVSSY